MYTVIGNNTSRAFRVLWALEELGQPYEQDAVKPHSERVRALSPAGKIPVLLDGDEAITDSTAIMTYLADKHGQLTAPAGTLDRARQDAMTHALLDEIDAVLWVAARHSFILPEDRRMPAIKDSLKWEYERNLGPILDRRAGTYLMGEDFTVPDIILAHCLGWAKAAGFPSEHEGARDYLKACRSRPAFQRLAG